LDTFISIEANSKIWKLGEKRIILTSVQNSQGNVGGGILEGRLHKRTQACIRLLKTGDLSGVKGSGEKQIIVNKKG